ncbi:FecCD family ABC transporter permease [Halotalea alkalilenta]|uniref:FecCD family ABC transporter permease n=1 Tax=Halotalea alkalilenta TaxID=376489 RepID=UPI0005BB7520|nr:iron ABC transporter permease [Halotalea alkalilenta]
MSAATGSVRFTRGLGFSLLALGVALCASLALGAGDVTPLQVLRWALGDDDGNVGFVVTELRLPRSCVGIVVGAALGVAGNLLQTVTRNPLAEPDLLGVSAASTTAVVIAILLGASVTTLQVWVAVLGAMCGCALVLAAARLRGVGDDPIRLILAGAALKGVLTALVSLVLLVDQRSADEIRFWTIGALAGRGYGELLGVAAPLLLGVLLVAYLSRPLAALALGERVASGLGHRPRLTRWLTLLAVALLSGVAVALAGPIAFFGLVVPVLARALVGPDIRRTLPLCVLLGPAVLLAADVVARLLVRPSELPLGVVTAVIGAPVLVAVVRAHRLPRL